MTDTTAPRLFRLAPEAITITARHEVHGWYVLIRVRRGDETWDEVQGEVYEYLGPAELEQAVCAALGAALGL